MSAIGDGLPKVVTTSATPQDLVSGLAQANLSTEQLVSGGNWKLCLPLSVTSGLLPQSGGFQFSISLPEN